MNLDHIPRLDPSLNLKEAAPPRNERPSATGGVAEGGRNDANFHEAVRVRKAGGGEAAVRNAVRELNSKHSPPQSDAEVNDIVARVVAKVQPSAAKQSDRTPKRWPTLWADEADGSRAAEFVIDDVIHAGAVGMLYGASGTLKTQMVLDWFAHVAQGIPWRGRKTKQGRCVYVAAEGAGGIEARLAALCGEHPCMAPRSILAFTRSVQLLPEVEVEQFADQMIEDMQPSFAAPVRTIGFDTYSQSTVGGAGEEEAFQRAERNVRDLVARIADVQGGIAPAGVLAHHNGKDAGRGARGTSAMKCNLDFMVEAQADSEDRTIPIDQRTFRLHLEKVKDGPDGIVIPYGAALRQVGTRADDGKLIFAPVVRELDAERIEATKRAKTYKPKSDSWPARALDALEILRARDGAQIVPEDVIEASGYRARRPTAPPPHQVEGFQRETVAAFLDDKFAPTTARNASKRGQSSDTLDANHRRQRDRALKTLEGRAMIHVFDGWLWLEAQ